MKPVVQFTSVGVQCSLECPQSVSGTRDIGVRCMGPISKQFYQQCSSPIPSDSSQSDVQLTDHDTSAFTLQEDLSS